MLIIFNVTTKKASLKSTETVSCFQTLYIHIVFQKAIDTMLPCVKCKNSGREAQTIIYKQNAHLLEM